MKKSTLAIIIAVVIIIIIGLYWFISGSSSTTEVTPATTSADQTTSPVDTETGTPVLSLGSDAVLGAYLKSAVTGMSLYTYKNDSPNTSTCTDDCAVNWPPYTVASPDSLTATGIPGTVGTIIRQDGTYQVTYNGMPLYFYVKDVVQGDLTGNGVGGVWSVAIPSQASAS